MKLHVNVLKFSYFFYRIIDRITEFSFIIFSYFIHFMKCFILSTMNYQMFFFHRYQLYIAFYYSYVNPLTINPYDARINNLVRKRGDKYFGIWDSIRYLKNYQSQKKRFQSSLFFIFSTPNKQLPKYTHNVYL